MLNGFNEYYNVIKNVSTSNRYVFNTKGNTEYELILSPSGITYATNNGERKNIVEFAINCELSRVNRDTKTLKTIIKFCSELSEFSEAIYFRTHNQPESDTQRRGQIRLKLWSRIINQYFSDYVLLTNLVLVPNKDSDILCLVVKKDSIYYNQLVTNFYRFCDLQMYKR